MIKKETILKIINNKIKAIQEQRKAEVKKDLYYLEFAECLLNEIKDQTNLEVKKWV